MALFEILPRHGFSPDEIGRLEERLYTFNRVATGRDDGMGLGFSAIDARGEQIGAIAGYTWAGMAEIRQLWVEEAARGMGVGRRLLEAAIAEASARGCRFVCVSSHSFQAPTLYERCGVRRIAELPEWPPGHSLIVLRRQL